ncbi:hypothetical protein BGZ83_011823, partial [Gryganskiella cystojenkinii]
MNNGAAIVYINMQEPCSKDLPPLCSAALAMARADEPETANLSDDTDEVVKAEGIHSLRKRNRHGHHKYRHNKHCHNHDNNKHPYKDLCVAVGDFCGNKLYGCDFVATTQYRCDAIGERPWPIAEDSAFCGGTNACLCPASPTGLICGSDLPKECKAYRNSVYDCSCGAGTTPKLSRHCEPGVVCRKDDASKDATCGPITCDCVGDHEVCSNVFPDSCGFDKNVIYKCTPSGKPEKKNDCQDNESCVTLSGGAACAKNDCKCSTDGDVCGAVFPHHCRISSGDIYSCVKGEDPVLKEDCSTSKCIATKGYSMAAAAAVFQAATAADNCVEDLCKCQEKKLACGLTFPEDCKFSKDTLYECSAVGATPQEVERCDVDKCVISAGDNMCDGGSCTCKDNDLTCGSAFPTKCNLDPKTLYNCARAGSKPTVGKICPTGCIEKEGNDECSNICVCREAKESVCGKNFDMSCNLDDGTLYKCASSGATPTPIEKCKAGCESGGGDSGDVCKDPCVCPTSGEMRVCGSELPAECKADKNAVYYCPGGARSKPSLIGHCMPGVECVRERASDNAVCGTHNCDCVGNHEVCSDFFPSKCGLEPHTIYKCTASGKHEKVAWCKAGETCITVSDGSICRIDDCKCLSDGPTCGEAFPAKCNIPTEALYDCRKGEDPVLKSTCDRPGRCSASKSSVSATAVFKAAADDKCVD